MTEKTKWPEPKPPVAPEVATAAPDVVVPVAETVVEAIPVIEPVPATAPEVPKAVFIKLVRDPMVFPETNEALLNIAEDIDPWLADGWVKA